MQNAPELRVLFPTSFSDACFRTSRAIAQLADNCRVSLTIAHVCKPGSATTAQGRELDSFMAEADHYDDCCRMLLEADDAVEAIGAVCDGGGFDLVVAPASDRLGLKRMLTSSFRARLLKRCAAPVWTAGHCLQRFTFKPGIQTIACLLDFDSRSDVHIRTAASLARRTGAKMRIITVIEPVDEGTLVRSVYSNAPLLPEAAVRRIRAAFGDQGSAGIDVSVGTLGAELPKLLAKCDADLLFVGPNQVLKGVLKTRTAPWLDRLPCPVVCLDGASAGFRGWPFHHGSFAASAGALAPLATREEAFAAH